MGNPLHRRSEKRATMNPYSNSFPSSWSVRTMMVDGVQRPSLHGPFPWKCKCATVTSEAGSFERGRGESDDRTTVSVRWHLSRMVPTFKKIYKFFFKRNTGTYIMYSFIWKNSLVLVLIRGWTFFPNRNTLNVWNTFLKRGTDFREEHRNTEHLTSFFLNSTLI